MTTETQDVQLPESKRGLKIPASGEHIDGSHAKQSPRRLVFSAAVWALYVPHLAIIRLLGRRLGAYWIGMAATVHWLATFLGANRHTLAVLRRVHPHLDIKISPREILRRHLKFKHHCFAEQRAFALSGRRQQTAAHDWNANGSQLETMQKLFRNERGAIVISYHFGCFRLAAHEAPKVFPDVKFCQVRDPESPYQHLTHPLIAKLTGLKAVADDRGMGSQVVYLDASVPPLELTHRLRDGHVLMLAADGMVASSFEDIPFLGGSIRLPVGWAFLAGLLKVPVVVIMDKTVGNSRRTIELCEVIRCQSNQPQDVRQALIQATRVLEKAVRQTPWVWHPWSRLEISNANGKEHYVLNTDFIQHPRR